MFNRSSLRAASKNGTFQFPKGEPLFEDNKGTLYFVVGDDAFPLRMWLM